MAQDPIEQAMISGLTARGYTVTAPDGKAHAPSKVLEVAKPVERWHLRDGVEVKTLSAEVTLHEQWRGGSHADDEMRHARRECALSMARKLVEDGFVRFTEGRDGYAMHLRAELIIGVPGSKKSPAAPMSATGRGSLTTKQHVLPGWVSDAAMAGVFSPGATDAILRLAQQRNGLGDTAIRGSLSRMAGIHDEINDTIATALVNTGKGA